MTPEEANPKAHHQTVRGARLALARKEISQDSYRAVLAGEISLARAKELGRSGTPTDTPEGRSGPGTTTTAARGAQEQPSGDAPQDAPAGPRFTSRISKDDRTPTKTPCLCGCGELVPRRFAQGHDMVMFRVAREHLTEGRELTDEQREYLETSGKMERARARLAKEEAKRQEKEARKAEAQRQDK